MTEKQRTKRKPLPDPYYIEIRGVLFRVKRVSVWKPRPVDGEARMMPRMVVERVECPESAFDGDYSDMDRPAPAGHQNERRMMETKKQFWLVKLDQHGNPFLNDGPHSERAGVEKALYLITALGLNRGAKYACAEITLTEVEAIAHDTNHDAVAVLNSIGLRQ